MAYESKEILESLDDGQYTTIYGIKIWSRYDHGRELQEMIDFCRIAADRGLDGYVEDLFYDSKACICFFTLASHLEQSSVESKALSCIAYLTIGQYDWFGVIGHKMGEGAVLS